MITLVDTSELKRPTQRKLHAAWCELQREQVLATPGVADELAPLAANVLWREGRARPSARCRFLTRWWTGSDFDAGGLRSGDPEEGLASGSPKMIGRSSAVEMRTVLS